MSSPPPPRIRMRGFFDPNFFDSNFFDTGLRPQHRTGYTDGAPVAFRLTAAGRLAYSDAIARESTEGLDGDHLRGVEQ